MTFTYLVLALATLRVSTAECPPYWSAALCELSASIQGSLYTPLDEGYDEAVYVQNEFAVNTPVVAIVPLVQDDVRESILYAESEGLKVTIASGGHDLLTRNAGNGTLHFYLKHLNQNEIVADSSVPSGAVIRVGAGGHWEDIMDQAMAAGFWVNGLHGTIAPGGSLPGGGLTFLETFLGYGSDYVTRFKMISADGSIVSSTKSESLRVYPDGSSIIYHGDDLFWSILGAGCNSYGVIVEYDLELSTPPETFLKAVMIHTLTGSAFKDESKVLMRELVEFQNKYRGYHAIQSSIVNLPGPTPGTMFVSQLSAIIPMEDTDALVKEFFAIGEEWQYSAEVPINTTNPLTIVEALKELPDLLTKPTLKNPTGNFALRDDTEPDSFKPYVFNRFLHNDHIDTEDKRDHLSDTLMEAMDYKVDGFVMLRTIEGHVNSFPLEYSSLSPAYRTSSLVAIASFTVEDTDMKDSVQEIQAYSQVFHQLGWGTYTSEADYFIDQLVEDWRVEFWGPLERYARLLSVKRFWDPTTMFMCHHCVGHGELFF